MKTQYIFLSFLFVLASIFTIHAQKATGSSLKKETIQVWGECGMCKNKIEKAAKTAGASNASWNEESKLLAVSYNSNKTSGTKIQQAIAAAGYDTKDLAAPAEVYSHLPGCCHYERKEAAAKQASGNCCSNAMACGKAGKCDQTNVACKDMDACKEKGCCKS
ncbi:MAG: heavy-metal-associated domain-containing protein [Chitinophagaceae bacterium]